MSEWISVEDRLPPDYHEVMYFATANNDGTREIMIGHYNAGHWLHCCLFYASNILNDNVKVTHWMELPEYPTYGADL